MPELKVERRAGTARIRVRVKPNASKSCVFGVISGVLEVAVAAPPVAGEANRELIRVMAAVLGHRKSAIQIVSGEGSRRKLLSIAGMTQAELVAKLGLTASEGAAG